MKILLRFSLILLLVSCSTGQFTTTNFHNLAGFEDNSHIYALPKTRLIVSLSVEKTEFIPGPYSKYASKYLGIEGTQSLSSNFYKIVDIELKTQSLADPDYTYSVLNDNFSDIELVLNEFRSKGLIMGESTSEYFKSDKEIQEEPEEIHYTDLSIKSFNSEQGKNITSENEEYTNVPLLAKQVSPKSLDEKAEEAAKFLFKIRKRRFKLLSGQYEVFPEGIAMETSIKELNRLEDEYLSLFIGKKTQTTLSRTYTFTPNDSEQIQRYTLFRFAEDSGFHPTGGRVGDAIILEVTDLNTNTTLSQLSGTSASGNTNVLYIRLADRANAKIFYGSHEVLEAEIPVFQFGVIIPKFISTEQ